MSVNLVGHFSNGLSMLSVRAEPHKGYIPESAELSGIVPRLGFK